MSLKFSAAVGKIGIVFGRKAEESKDEEAEPPLPSVTERPLIVLSRIEIYQKEINNLANKNLRLYNERPKGFLFEAGKNRSKIDLLRAEIRKLKKL